jgi:pyrimidine and pyridine-specific 5'-nucleotidase
MGMDMKVAEELSFKYYKQYGLAIRGLIKHHEVDPVDYDNFVDGGLPLEELLTPSAELIGVLNRLRTDRWVFTNAGRCGCFLFLED